MRAQIDFSNTPTFQKFMLELSRLEGSSVHGVVQGVLIDYHPLWWGLWNYEQTTGLDVDRNWDRWLHWALPPFGASHLPVPSVQVSAPDPTWSPSVWQELLSSQDKSTEHSPFLVKICVAPIAADHPDLRQLRALAARQPFTCVVEFRGVARATASLDGGGEITATRNGTVGGFLKDQYGRIYGQTCAHVAETPGSPVHIHDVNAVTLRNAGIVTESTYSSLTALGTNQLCNRQTVAGGAGAAALDAALFEVVGSHTATGAIKRVGVVDDVFNSSQFGSGHPIELHGAVSHHHNGYVGAYAAVYKVLFPDTNFYCFDHMFEVRSQNLFGTVLPPSLAHKVVSGDSGAWVCAASGNNSGNFAYCGTIVATDGLSAYACFAEAVILWASQQSLTLSPA